MTKRKMTALLALMICAFATGCGNVEERDVQTPGETASIKEMISQVDSESVEIEEADFTSSAAPETEDDSAVETKLETETNIIIETIPEEDIEDTEKDLSVQYGIYIEPENIEVSYRDDLEYEPSKAECEELLGLAVNVYQAAVSGDRNRYLNVDSYRPLLPKLYELHQASGGTDGKYMEMTRQRPKYDIMIEAYNLAWMCTSDDMRAKVVNIEVESEEDYMPILEKALDRIDVSTCLMDQYFELAQNLDPIEVGNGLTCELTVKSCQRFDDDLYINYTASIYNGERTYRLANVYGWNVDGVSGTYIEYYN